MYVREKSLFERFFENRSILIMQYENGDLTKQEFLEMNYDYMRRINAKPFLKVDSFEKGIYNYQYYNVLAKYYLSLAKDVKDTKKHKKYYDLYLNKGYNYYHEKDKATLDLMRFLNFEGIEAYFVKSKSKFLDGKLYEIVLLDYEEAIFHSKAQWLLDIMRKEGIFLEEKRISVIDRYINKDY